MISSISDCIDQGHDVRFCGNMILTSCQTYSVQVISNVLKVFCRAAPAVQTGPAPNVALRSPLRHGYWMFHGLSGSALPLPRRRWGNPCTVRALRATFKLDSRVKSPHTDPFQTPSKLGHPSYPSSRQLRITFPSHQMP